MSTQATITITFPVSHRVSRDMVLALASHRAAEQPDGAVTIAWSDGTTTPISEGGDYPLDSDICTGTTEHYVPDSHPLRQRLHAADIRDARALAGVR